MTQLSEDDRRAIELEVRRLLQDDEITRRQFLFDETREHKQFLHKFGYIVASTFFILLSIAAVLMYFLLGKEVDNTLVTLGLDDRIEGIINLRANEQLGRHQEIMTSQSNQFTNLVADTTIEFQEIVEQTKTELLSTLADEVFLAASVRLDAEFQERLDSDVRDVVSSTIAESGLEELQAALARVVPSSMVAAFAGIGCPEGWRQFDPANGRVIVGIDGRQEYAVTLHGGVPDFATGGEEEVTLTEEQMPTHDHATIVGRSPEDSRGWERIYVGDVVTMAVHNDFYFGGETHATAVAGSATPHNNMPPYIALYWCTPE